MPQAVQSPRSSPIKTEFSYVSPSSRDYSHHLKVSGDLDEIHKIKISCRGRNGSVCDLSIDNSDTNLIERKLDNIAKVRLTRDSKGVSVLSVEKSLNFDGEILITSADGLIENLTSTEQITDLQLPKINSDHFEIKVEVPNLNAKPIDKTANPELYEQYENFKKIGGEIVVVEDKEHGFAYELRRGEQVITTIQPPATRVNFHIIRDNLLSASLEKLAKQEKSSLIYKGKEIPFSKMQSPELYQHTQRLAQAGINLTVTSQNNGDLIINLTDKNTGYKSSTSIEVSTEQFTSMARGKEHLSNEFLTLLNSMNHRSDLLLRSDGKSTNEFNSRVQKLAVKIPNRAIDILMKDRWSITAKNHIPSRMTLADNPNKERLPIGRCIPAEKGLQLAEFQTSTQVVGQRASDPNNAIYHEVAHALYYKIQSERYEIETGLKIALERDLNQLGDLSKIDRSKDPELPDKLRYYSSLSEGFAESYEGMISSESNGGKIMPTYFPNFFKACEQLVKVENLL